jgi:peptide/nickel transport system permease protein
VSYRRFFLIRTLWAVLGFWVAATAIFVTFFVLQEDPARALVGGEQARQAAIRFARSEYHLDASLPEQYGSFLWRVVTDQSAGPDLFFASDDGTPIESGRLARDALAQTLSLIAFGLVFALGLAALAAKLSLRTQWRRIFDFPVYVAFGLFPVVVGIVLAYHLGVKGPLPPGGYCDVFSPSRYDQCGGPVDWTSHLVLPGLTFSLYFAAIYTRVIRAGLARARAAEEGEQRRERRTFVIALGRAVGNDLGFLISAAALVEVLFGINGLGHMAIFGIQSENWVDVASALLYGTFFALGGQFVVDVVAAALDPDVRDVWRFVARPKRAT